MKHRIKPGAYRWMLGLAAGYFFLLLGCLAWHIAADGETPSLLAVAVIIVIGLVSIILDRCTGFRKVRRMTRLLDQHIAENHLCEWDDTDYIFYPEAFWWTDPQDSSLHIEFRLPGNSIDFRELEQGLADRLQLDCLNVFEKHGYIEYIFAADDRRLVIRSQEDIPLSYGDSEIPLSSTLSWDYKKYPGFMIIGATGSGKTKFCQYLILRFIAAGVHATYVDLKRDMDMEYFCHEAGGIKYVYRPEDVVQAIAEVAGELEKRGQAIDELKAHGVDPKHVGEFLPVFLIVDELILTRLVLDNKSYKQIIENIQKIIVSGRSYQLYCGLVSQSGNGEYLGGAEFRRNIGLKAVLGNLSGKEYAMAFGEEFSQVRNLRYGEVGSGLIMRNAVDSRPRTFLSPYMDMSHRVV